MPKPDYPVLAVVDATRTPRWIPLRDVVGHYAVKELTRGCAVSASLRVLLRDCDPIDLGEREGNKFLATLRDWQGQAAA